MLPPDIGLAVERRQRPRGAQQGQLRAQPIRAEPHAQPGRILQHRVGHLDGGQQVPRRLDPLADAGVLRPPLGGEAGAVPVERVAAPYDSDPRRDLAGRLHLDRQPESVEQLRAQLALLRVAAADQHEARRVADAQAFPLHHVLAGRGHVDQEVHQVVLQQVHLVDIQEAAVGAGEQAGFERLLAAGQRAFQVERAHHPVLRRPQRHVDHGYRGHVLRCLAGRAVPALGAEPRLALRCAIVRASRHHGHSRQQAGQRAHGGRLAGAAVAEHQDAAHRRVGGGDQQRLFHFVLADDGGKRKGLPHQAAVRRGSGRSCMDATVAGRSAALKPAR